MFTINRTLKASTLSNRGYERSVYPRIANTIETSTLKECPNSVMGDPFRVDVPLIVPIRGYCAPPVIERRRFQRLGGTIADNHNIFLLFVFCLGISLLVISFVIKVDAV